MEEEQTEVNKSEKKPVKGPPATRAELIAFAFDVGLAVAVPLVIFAFGGRELDRYYNTSPTFLVIGLLLSLISTGIAIWNKVKNFL